MPLGVVMGWMFGFLKNYFVTIFLFTLLVRVCLFPLSLKQQKATMDRARLAPRLERLQKKYGQDRQKLMQKQQELYERHGVKMTPGCLPMILQMLILMGVIAVIYSPLTTLANPKIDDAIISVSQQAIVQEMKMDEKTAEREFYTGYYGELKLMLRCDEGNNKQAIIEAVKNP
ncbi:MAG: membrane protein insertase YidC, partial [Clostridia bacterium]|nr:membrane protein insertase YidC [Clostridia bacterium]